MQPHTQSYHNPSSPSSSSTHRSLRSPSSLSPAPVRERLPTPAFSRPPSTSNITTDSRYPPIRSLTTPSPPKFIPSTPPRQIRTTRASPPSTLTRAVNTSLPLSPSGTLYYSSPPSAFPSHLETSNQDVELTPITPRRTPPSISIHDSPFDDRHSEILDRNVDSSRSPSVSKAPDHDNDLEMICDEDPFEYSEIRVSGGKQRTMPGYKFTSLSPRGWDEKGEPLTFGPMLDDIRPISEARRSLYPSLAPVPPTTFEDHPDIPSSKTKSLSLPTLSNRPKHTVDPIRPTFRGLYTLSSMSEYILLLIPAMVLSILSALIAPYMSMIIGDAFSVFAAYPFLTGEASDAERAALKNGVTDTSLKFTIAGILAVLFNYFKGVFWVRYGESVAARLRETVYIGVQDKTMEWFDMGMGMNAAEEIHAEKREAIGAGGLMSKFTRETDDVRLACALSSGDVVTNLAIFILCFILAMKTSPILALVTLSTIPLVVLTQIITQVLAAPLHASERRAFAEASTNVERVTAAIATVKVHNAQQVEQERFLDLVGKGKQSLIKQGLVWGISTGLTDLLLLGTFVLGFWYGAKIVRDGKSTSGEVMTCFWACLFSATYLQQVIPHLTGITKGKNSMASLLTIIKEDLDKNRPISNISNPFSPTTQQYDQSVSKSHQFTLGGIKPIRCHGEFNFQNVSFAYPSRPDQFVLKDVSIFIPPGETTFIVGGSGSGKSTIAQLLLRLYGPISGEITMDNQAFNFLDPSFTKENIAAIQQGCILFDMSIHDNVSLGLAGSNPTLNPLNGKIENRSPEDVTREEVVGACQMAMIHDFIKCLPDGYKTKLGSGGNSLSGGQKQRLAIARARIRNPTVLILDEATSALDPTSRVQVFQNLKSWRHNRTTIVITHDLSQIVSDDFVYVMHNGVISEQGFRVDLMKKTNGVFAEMAAEQAVTPFPIKRISNDKNWEDGLEEILDMEKEFEEVLDDRHRPLSVTPSFTALSVRPTSVYMDMMDEYSKGNKTFTPQNARRLSNAQKRLTWTPQDLGSRAPSRFSDSRPESRISRRTGIDQSPRISVRGNIDSSRLHPSFDSSCLPNQLAPEKEGELLHAGWMEKQSPFSSNSRSSMSLRQRQQRTLSENLEDDLKATDLSVQLTVPPEAPVGPVPGLIALIRLYFPTLPSKLLLLLGCIGSVGHGVTTPVWSFFLAKLLQIVGSGGTDTSALTKYGLIILGLCVAQGCCDCLSEWALVGCSARWSFQIRTVAFNKLINQDKSFFDESKNSPSRLVQILIKDADDARTLMSHVIGKAVTVTTMIGLGIIWAMVVGWQLTFIGIVLAPLFGGFIAFNVWLMGKREVIHKAGRENVARTFYESIANIRGIRAMTLDSAFRAKFQQDAIQAKQLGDKTAWTIAMGGAVAAAIPLFAQALMNWAGAQFMLKNIMNYQEMLQVYNLVLFSLTFSAGMLDFIPTMAKARVAARDFNRLYLLSTTTSESQGELRFPVTGQITFSNIHFSYPTRPDVPILEDLSFTINAGECVAIVGPSGSGKSTIASLLQRLYVPQKGTIKLDKYDLGSADTKFLRNHIAVVSQSANLFDNSIKENISYGNSYSLVEIQRAAKLANIHEFIISLPDGYDTNLGENASLISGGQAQRIQIARALCRSSDILILDECTSALDVDNARAILDTIGKIKESRTTVFITHSVEAMRRCDRIICLGEGRVVEDGSFEELISRGGEFAQLMRTGEWK
ncbi:uncharacterized protein IL334_003889 [Kwoniella shivajii]|uniref:ATP-binding cassette, subfamily B (MDR/TAP), member 1 n=1 Tax=Kwoniella shivajii TaxID=564305 RepID=A0ABZ1CYV3_9TREE|nr:hypothetical protein IL334_003889 [Kwoniella shivajii]